MPQPTLHPHAGRSAHVSKIADPKLRRLFRTVQGGLLGSLALAVAIGSWAWTRGLGLLGAALILTAAAAPVAVAILARGVATAGRTAERRLEAAGAALADEADRRRKAEARARAGDRAKTEFLAVMSHELRTPLNGVIGVSGLLLRERLNARQLDYVRIIRESGEALLTLFNEILEFSRSQAADLELEIVEFDLSQAMAEVYDLLDAKAAAKDLSLAHRLAPGVPPRLEGDVARLRQILLHLVDNAIKFTPRGEVVTTVALAGDDGARATLRFEVEDRGIGIDDELRGRLFEPFEQGDGSMSRRFGGTGMGLAIARRLVAILGGDIGVDSAPGRGSTFWFTLQMARPGQRTEDAGDGESPDGARLQPDRTPARFARHLCRRRVESDHVLVVEDNGVSLTVTVRQLELLGYRADVAGNGREAVELARRIAYAAVLMDCQMPIMSGFDATAEIRALEHGGRHTPIIALTANALAGDRQRALSAGMDDYLVKPVALERLDRSLRRWCRPARPRRAIRGR